MTFEDIFEQIIQIFNLTLFDISGTPVTLWMLFYVVAASFLTFYLTKRLHRWIVRFLLVRSSMETGNREATATIIRYIALVIGFIIVLETTGIDLTVLNVLAGTLGIGVGFGLQNIVNNFVSGLIILIEKPVKVGDRIEVGGIHGRVIRIGARSATVLTNDNISIIVPNQKFISENIVNWSHTDDMRRFLIPVVVAPDSDPYLVKKLLLEAAKEDPDVLDDPAPGVRLFGFGEKGMDFELRAWSSSLMHRRGLLTSNLNFAMLYKFRENDIALFIPQREVFLQQREPDQSI